MIIWVPNYRDCTNPAEPRDTKPLQSLLQYFPLLSINSSETTIFSACNRPLWISPNALRLYLKPMRMQVPIWNLWESRVSSTSTTGVLILLAGRSDNSYTVCLAHLVVSLADLLAFHTSRCFRLICVQNIKHKDLLSFSKASFNLIPLSVPFPQKWKISFSFSQWFSVQFSLRYRFQSECF